MLNKKQLASEAIAKALRIRKRLAIPYDESVSALDAAEQLGIEVRMTDLPSMEGMYVSAKRPTIVLSCLRPQGRRSFTCAHEIGHHILGHGEQFDELVKDKSFTRSTDSKEFQADCFAAFFLMPKATIEAGLSLRGYSYSTLDPLQAYLLANWLGVSYGALINHLVHGLGVIARSRGEQMLKCQPRDIRKQLVGRSDTPHLIVVDKYWKGRAIDCEVGDYIKLPPQTTIEAEHRLYVTVDQGGVMAQASKPGLARVANSEWSAFVRISPRNYVGRSCYRFEEEVEE